MQYIIEDKLAQAILNYLTEKPYREVAALINALSKMKPVEEPKTQKEIQEQPTLEVQ